MKPIINQPQKSYNKISVYRLLNSNLKIKPTLQFLQTPSVMMTIPPDSPTFSTTKTQKTSSPKPKNIQQNRNIDLIQAKENDLIEKAQKMLQQNKYIYLDLGSQQLLKQMQKQNQLSKPSKPEQIQRYQQQLQILLEMDQCQRLGSKFVITNINNLSKDTIHLSNFLANIKASDKKKLKIRQQIAKRLMLIKKSKMLSRDNKRIQKKGQHQIHYSNNKQQKNEDLKQYLLKRKLKQMLNKDHLHNKQKNIINKFGLKYDYGFPIITETEKYNNQNKSTSNSKLTTTPIKQTKNLASLKYHSNPFPKIVSKPQTQSMSNRNIQTGGEYKNLKKQYRFWDQLQEGGQLKIIIGKQRKRFLENKWNGYYN